MAKTKKRASDAWEPGAIAAFLAEHSLKAMSRGKKDLLDPVESASDVGLRLPHLALRYLFQKSTFPFERSTIIYGPTGSNKSSFLYWFYYLFNRYCGEYLHLENEDKDTGALRLSLTRYNKVGGFTYKCSSMDDFQNTAQWGVDNHMARCSAEGGPGKRIPFVIGIDSLTAKMTAAAAEVVEDNNGVVGRRYADEARSLADWFRYFPSKLQRWPLCMIAVNHDKPKPAKHGPGQEHHTPGGAAPNYYATYKILTTRIRSIPQNAAGWEGNRIRLFADKTGLGAGKQYIEAEIGWKYAAHTLESGRVVQRQVTVWNWDVATTELLHRLATSGSKGGARGAAVRDLVGIQKQTGGKYSSQKLGIAPRDAVKPGEFAKILEQQTDLLAQLEPLLGIHNGYEFQIGMDFAKEREAAIKAAEQAYATPFVPEETLDLPDGYDDTTSTGDSPGSAAADDGGDGEEVGRGEA